MPLTVRHRQGPVCQGRIYKRVIEPIDQDGTVRTLDYDEHVTNIVCSWHGALFEPETGDCLAGPCVGRGLTPWPLGVVDGTIVTA